MQAGAVLAKWDKFCGLANSVQAPQRSDSRGGGGSRTAQLRSRGRGRAPAPAAAVQGRRRPAAAAGMLAADTASAQWNTPG